MEQVQRVAAEVNGADVDRLQLVLSRLMARSGSSAEAQPVADAANRIASTSADQVMAGRARLLADRVQQYQRVAIRRDGATVMGRSTLGTPVIPAGAVTAEQQQQWRVYRSSGNARQPVRTESVGPRCSQVTWSKFTRLAPTVLRLL